LKMSLGCILPILVCLKIHFVIIFVSFSGHAREMLGRLLSLLDFLKIFWFLDSVGNRELIN
jgi:hypothetical protein